MPLEKIEQFEKVQNPAEIASPGKPDSYLVHNEGPKVAKFLIGVNKAEQARDRRRTRVVKKRVKQRDPLIPRVFLPIPEKSFELPDQEQTESDPVAAPLLDPVSVQMFPPLPPPPPLPPGPVPEIPPPPEVLDFVDYFPYFEPEMPDFPPLELPMFDVPDMIDLPQWDDLESQIPIPQLEIPDIPQMEPEAELPVYVPMEQPVLFPAPLAIYAPIPGVYQFLQAEFMDEIVVDGPLPSQGSSTDLHEHDTVTYQRFQEEREERIQWQNQCREILGLFETQADGPVQALRSDYILRERLRQIYRVSSQQLTDLRQQDISTEIAYRRALGLTEAVLEALQELSHVPPGF
ncbi:hypothetical protein AgCh_025183 [Apium graveolens]